MNEGEHLKFGEPSEWAFPLTQDFDVKEVSVIPASELEPFLTYYPKTGVV